MSEVLHRVKVYKLSADNGTWQDCGTGHISVEYMEQAHAMGLIVFSEDKDDNGRMLLAHKISPKDIYKRQGGETLEDGTIISWKDDELNTEVAISFQEVVGCSHIWNQMEQVRREVFAPGPAGPHGLDYDQHAGSEFEGPDYAYDGQAGDLPAPEIANLQEIAKILSQATAFQRERLAAALLRPGYLPSLLDIFKQCEDLEDTDSLKHLFLIVKHMIMANDSQLLEELFKEEHVMDVVGALEHDPELRSPPKHREFLAGCVLFKEVVPIRSPALVAKIHQTYRIQYLKDVILPRSLDDATYATLSSLALFNTVEVVGALQADPDFLRQLFLELDRHATSGQEWADLVAFLQEFCSLARHLQPGPRQALFAKLVQLGLFDQVTRIMTCGSDPVKYKATDILMSVMQHDTAGLRSFLQAQPDHTLLTLLVREMCEGTEISGLPEQVAELLKVLLDPETMETTIDKSEFLDIFYDKYTARLLDVITNDRAISGGREGSRCVPASTLSLLVDFFSFCVQHHALRIKYFLLKNQVMQKIVQITRRKERWLACAAIRFLRTIVALKDDFYNRQMVKHNVFEPLMASFFENGDRYNLLNSAMLDLVDFIRKNNVKPLIEHLVSQYSHRFDEVDYVDTFKALKLRHEQAAEGGDDEASTRGGAPGGDAGPGIRGRFAFGLNGEPLSGTAGGGGLLPLRRRRDERGLDRDEEDYFSEDVDDDSGAPGTSYGDLPPGLGAAGDSSSTYLTQRFHRAESAEGAGPAAPSSDLGSRRPQQQLQQGGGGAGGAGRGGPAGAGPLQQRAAAGVAGAGGAGGDDGSPQQQAWGGLSEYDEEEEEGEQQQQASGGQASAGSPALQKQQQQQQSGADARKKLKGGPDDSPQRSPKSTWG